MYYNSFDHGADGTSGAAGARHGCRQLPGHPLHAPLIQCILALLIVVAVCPTHLEAASEQKLDNFNDTWTAIDALGRSHPCFSEVGPPRPDREVALFYFLWLGPHVTGGPHDITKILTRDPEAMQKKNSPLWGPMLAPHHWGESYFGYYLTHDPTVLKRHAQMMADAGVDAVIFDVTNQLTYSTNVLALLRAFAEVRQNGGKTPRIAFLCPFWSPRKVVMELYQTLYAPGVHPELWYTRDGKPLILADSNLIHTATTFSKHELPVTLSNDHTLGQSFTAKQQFSSVGGSFPTWNATNSGLTLTLRREGPQGAVVQSRRFPRVADNAWTSLEFADPLAPGVYYLEASAPAGKIGWWSQTKRPVADGRAYVDGQPVAGGRDLSLGGDQAQLTRLRDFFTWRKPQPDYFQGPTQPDMWSWLEVYPQHVFRNSKGEREQMSVGVAQNAVTNRLGCLSEPGARGRNYHHGTNDTTPDAVLRGLNFAEQFERALQEDPRVLFITGWNEWIAVRFDEFSGVRQPVMFVDQFNQERSRDIEPMKGGHGDNYYYQMAAFIRRYKGVRQPPKAGPPKTIDLRAGFAAWAGVTPEYRDDRGDVWHRDFDGYNNCARYVNTSGRNDLVTARVARDATHLFFYVQTAQPITPPSSNDWMLLLVDADNNPRTGWEGFDYLINRTRRAPDRVIIEKNKGGWTWESVGEGSLAMSGCELQLSVPRAALGLKETPLSFDFKWTDRAPVSGDPITFIDQGDTAPNGRFRYAYRE